MKTHVPVLPGAAIAALFVFIQLLPAQEAPPEKVKKHYDMLLKRPAPGYLFDRFCNGWLDTATLDDLEKFLAARAAGQGTTADHLLLAYFHARQANSVKAIAQFRIALEKDPGSADAWYQKAVVEARTLNFDTALTDLEKAAAAKPRAEMEITIRQFQARLLIRSGKPDKAAEVFRALLATRPGDEELREDMIELEVAEGLMDEATAAAQELINLTKDPQKKVLRRLRLGDILQRAGKREEAVDIYAATLADTGSDSWLEKEIISQIEQVFRREDDIAGLRERLQRMIAAEPKRLALRLAQARMLTADGNAEAAMKAWQEILALTPGNRPLRESYIEQMAVLKKLPEAIAQMKELVAQHAIDLELLPRLADLHFQNKDTAQCLAALQQFIDKSDKQEGAWLRTAALMERYSLSSDALALLEKAAAALPESEAIAEAQAVTLHGMDKKAEAVAVWKKLAAGKSRERTVQVARMATTRNETEAAFDILHARLTDFEKDPLFLAELTASAVRVKREAEALPWARRRIALTIEATDLEPALDDAVRIIMTLNKEQDVIRETTDAATPQEWSLAAALHESLGNPKRAEELLAKVTAAMPELGGSLQVRLFMTRGEPVKAADALKKVIELPEGRKTAAVQRLVDLYQRAGRLEDALTWTAEWKRLSPGAVVPWEMEAHLLQLSGRSSDALKTLRQAAQMFPDNEDLKAGLARRYREDGRLADAQRLLEQLYEDGKDPGSKLKWVSELAQTAEQQGRTKELVESFEERRRTNRASTLPLLALSEIYRAAGSYEERRAALLEAARLKPDDLDLLMEIARIEQTQGELANAQETLRKARSLDQSNRATQKLAEVLFASGKDEEAVKMMEEIDTAKRLDPAAVETLAMSVIGSGEWERAETFLRPLVAKYPDNYRLHYLYGLMLEETGQNGAAQELFLKMLGMEKELQNARPPKHREMYDILRRHVPEVAVQITDMMNSAGSAYVHRQRSGGGSYYTSVNGVQTYVNAGGTPVKPYLPSDLREMRTLTLQHLAGLAQSMEEQAVVALKKDLAARGVVWAEHLTELTRRTSYGGNLPPQIAALLKAAPQEDYTLALLSLNMVYYPPDRYAPQIREAYGRFRERYPQLAAMALLALLRHDDAADIPLLKEGAGLIAGIEQPIDALSNSLSNVTWMATAEGGSIKPERKEIAKVIGEKLEVLYAAMPANSPARQNLQRSIFQACMNRHDWPRMMQLLEEELATALASSTLSNAAYRNYYYSGSSNQFIIEPPFPPRQLPQMPAMIANRWGLDDSGGSFYLNVPTEETEKFKAALRGGKEPGVRILVALRYGDEALINEMLKAASEAPEPGAAVCTIMAGWHASRSEPDKALEWLRRTQFLPLTRDDRAIVDRYLLGVITLGGLNPAPDTPDFTAARDAVVRLRQTKLDNQKRDAMAAALTALGLTDDADKLLAANAAAARSTPVASRPSTAQQTMDVKVEGFIKQGQKEKAMTLLLRELRMAARSATGGSAYRDADAMIRLTKRLNLKDEVLPQMKPAEGATTGLAEYGWLLTAFDDKDGGKEWYEKAVAARPRDLQMRLTAAGMYLNVEKPDVEAAWKLLEATPSDALAGMESGFMRFFGRGGPLDSQMANLEILRRFIEKHRKTPGLDWGWAINALEASVQQSTKDNITLPPLYMKPADQKLSLTRASKLKEWETKRRELHDDICRLMAEIPALRHQAFQRLASLRLAAEKDGDDLVVMAKEALVTKRDQAVENSIGYYGYYDEMGSQLPRPAPGDYLAETAFKKNDRALLEGAAAELEKIDQADAAKLLRAQAELFFCPEAEFEAKARAQIVPAKKDDRVLGDVAVVRIWQKRKLPPVLNAVLLEKFNQPEARRSGTASFPPDYLSTLMTMGHRDKAEAFLSEACAALLGPAEKRAEFLKQNWNPRAYSPPGTPGYMIRNMRQMFMQAAQKDELAVLAMNGLNDELIRYFDDVRKDDYYGGQLRPEDSALRNWPPSKNPERMKSILESSPFLADLPAWRPVAHPYSKGASVLAWMLKASVRAGSTPAVRKDSAAVLNQFPDTLGRAILLAAATAEKEEAMRRSVLDLLAARRSALESLPAERLSEVASFVKELAGDDPVKLKASAEAIALAEWLKPKLPGSDELAVFLKPADKWDKPVAANTWQQSVRKAMRLGAKESREKFHAVVAKAKALRIQGLHSPLSTQPKQENSPLAYALLGYLQDAAADRRKADDPAFWNSFVYAAEAALDPANGVDWEQQGIEGQALSAFTMAWRDCLKGRTPGDALTEFTARLSKVFTPEQFRLYSASFISLLGSASKSGFTVEQMQAWLASPAATATPLAAECRHLLSVDSTWKTPAAAKGEAVAAYTKHLLTFSRDEKLPAAARFTMTAAWLSHAGKDLPEEVTRQAASMLLNVWQRRLPWDVRDAEKVVLAILELPDAETRKELLKPLLAAVSRVSFVRLGRSLDEQLVAAAVQCDDKVLLQRIAGKSAGRVHQGFLAAMIREGAFDEARRWFEQHALSIDAKTAPDHAGWTKELAAKGTEFVKSFDAPHKTYLAEILLAMLPGTADEPKKTEQIRARTLPLAKKFGSVTFPDDAWRSRIIELLGSDDQVLAEAAPAFGPLAEKEPLGVLARSQGQPPRSKLRVLHLWIVNEFKQRRFGPLEQFLSDLSTRRMTNYYYSTNEDDPWVKAIRDTLKGTLHEAFMNGHEWTAEERAKLGAIYRTTLQQKTYIADTTQAEDVIQSALLYHAATGQNEALETWWKTIPEDQQKKTREKFWNSGINVWLTKEDLDKRYANDRPARLKFVKDYLVNPVGLNGGDNCMDRPATIEWATRQEIVDMADDLMTQVPRNGDTGRQLAVVAEKERAWEKGAAILAATVKHLDKDREKHEPRLLLQRALMLLQAGKVQETLAETEKLRPAVLAPFKDGKVETEALSGLAMWIETHGRALLAAGRSEDALAFLGINPSVQRLAVREAGGNLSDASLHESIFRYAEAKDGIKILNLVAKESIWRFRDAPDAPPANWNAPDADDSGWASGPGKLGYGDPVRTTLSFGPDKNAKPFAAYFRTTFDLADPKVAQSLHLGILRDDACIVYLNGEEILRQNMPEGPVTHETPATAKTDTTLESEYFPALLPAEHLVTGKNVIAVEIHQDSANSSDLTFDLQLRANLPDPTEIMRTLDPATIGPKLGDLWTALPESVRKALE